MTMNKAEYKALVGRIRKAEQLPVKERDKHRDLLDALIRQAARYEFEHHVLALYRFPEETIRICVRHMANHMIRLIQAADDETLAALIVRVKRVAAHVAERLGCDGYNIMQNNGEAAGQTVMHLHFHIIPRYAGKAFSFAGAKGDMDRLRALAERIAF